MCGIVAVLPAYEPALLAIPAVGSGPTVPTLRLRGRERFEPASICGALTALADAVDRCALRFARPGVAAALAQDASRRAQAVWASGRLCRQLATLDPLVDARSGDWGESATESTQRALRRAHDAAYALRNDRIGLVDAVRGLLPAGTPAPDAPTMTGYLALAGALLALDRLEVRGRDSAGITIQVQLPDAQLALLRGELADRLDPLLQAGSVRIDSHSVSFVHKHAAVIGRLGDNGRRLRTDIRADTQLHRAMRHPAARVTILAHTRWASVGAITEANAHPVDGTRDGRHVLAALNGDIDNHLALRSRLADVDERITTDAKVVPLLLAGGPLDGPESMAACLREIEGSVAVAALRSDVPGTLSLGVKGSGQALYVGRSPTGFVVASEVYGLVAAAEQYLRLDGSSVSTAVPAGVVVELSRDAGGGLEELIRCGADASPRSVQPQEWRRPEVTSRDLALGQADHYLQKEIGEAAASFRTTLRGRIRTVDGERRVELAPSSLPTVVADGLACGRITHVMLIGQGTSAVACRGIAEVVSGLMPRAIGVSATLATEFSAHGLTPDLRHCCIVAVSQSGSTTDTNRAVDLARARGAHVIAIVNRRESDLAAHSDGVVHTADGRDVEMAVASTKAFYAQVAAGCLLGIALARAAGMRSSEGEDRLLRALQAVPNQLEQIGREQDAIAAIARTTATRHQNWAVVGSGPNRVAAAEARIKLSELCYRTVSTDSVEDKKHIDLSAESLVLVCAAGTPPGQLSDLVKEVDIFAAHRNTPVVITDCVDAGWATPNVICVPSAHPALAWILGTAAAHLYAYYAALSIDACADPLRGALAALGTVTTAPAQEPSARAAVHAGVATVLDAIDAGELAGVLSAASVCRLTALAAGDPAGPRAAGGAGVFAQYTADPNAFTQQSLTQAVEELSRPIDAVRHQAKTVTVGTSRDESDLYDNDIVRALVDCGAAPAATLSRSTLLALRAHACLVTAVNGVARYRLRGEPAAEIKVGRRTGVAVRLHSRAERWAPVRGSKELVAHDRRVRLLRGTFDHRLVLVVPEQEGLTVVGLAVVHLDLVRVAEGATIAAALASCGTRLEEIRAAVTEADAAFSPEALSAVPPELALLAPVDTVAAALVQAIGCVA